MEYKLLHQKASVEDTAKSLHKLCEYNQEDTDSLLTGNLGRVVSLFNLAEYFDDPKYYNEAIEYLGRIIQRIGEKNGIKFSSAMSNGLSGLGSCLLLLEKCTFTIASDHGRKLLDWLAKKIYEKSVVEIQNSDLDAVYSSIGGLYFLSNYHQLFKNNNADLNDLVDTLYQQIGENGLGQCLVNKRYQQDGNYKIQLGIAHGICGIVLTLISVSQVVSTQKVEEMIKMSLNFLKKYYKPYEKGEKNFLFPRAVTSDGSPILQEKTNANIGWCTSDLSIVYTFLLCGKVLQDDLFLDFGNKLLSDFLKFDQKSLPIHDANLCHGFSGFSLLYKKCYDLTKRKECLRASQFWMKKAIDDVGNQTDDSLWFGKQGAYNVILSDLSDKKSHWNEILFLK